jgi:hypothetical protein
MARGDFLKSLSSGIFGEINNQEQLQSQRDFQEKQGLVQMLAGLADKIEPEGLPMLMGHIWDTMGIKRKSGGKGLRGFLDAFSGMPNRSVEDQLGTKFRDLTKGFVGPQEARDVRLRGNIASKGIPGLVGAAPDSAYGQKAAADMEGLKGRMVFRDPYQQELEKIRARSEAQAQLMSDRLALQNQYSALKQEDAQKHAISLENLRNENRTNRDHSRLTGLLFVADPEKYGHSYDAAHQEAAQMLVGKSQAEIEKIIKDAELKETLKGYYKAQTGVLKTGRPESPLQREKFDEQLYGKARGMFQKYGEAETEFGTQKAEYDRVGKILSGYAAARNKRKRNPQDQDVVFDEKLGRFVGPGDLGLNIMHEDLIKAYGKAGEKRTTAEGLMKTRGEELYQTHGKFVEALDGGKFRLKSPEEIKSGFKARRPVLPSGATNPNLPMGDGNTVRIPTDKSAEVQGWKAGDVVKPSYLKGQWVVGETMTEKGREFKVIRRQQ